MIFQAAIYVRQQSEAGMKSGVCIVECVDPEDPGSEGRLLSEIFKLMQIEHELQQVNSPEELFDALAQTKMKHAHVSTHGTVGDDDRFLGWWTPEGTGRKKIVDRLQPRLKCTGLVSTACKSGNAKFASYVVNTLGVEYYIAPRNSPWFHNAAFFCHIYYQKLFRTKRSVPAAFNSYEKYYRNPHGFVLRTRDAQ